MVASPTISVVMIVEQHKRDKERDRDMAHLKTQMDLLTKHLLSAKTQKLKVVASHGRNDSDSEEEENYLNNHGVSEAIAKEIKDGFIMIRLDIRIGIKETRRARIIGVDYMYLLEVDIML